MVGVGVMSAEDAISYGLTGPLLRATGVNYDVRKAQPYSGYDRFDFEVPVGSKGDNYDRFLVRFNEIEQSVRIVEQALRDIPDGPVRIDDPRYVLPDEERSVQQHRRPDEPLQADHGGGEGAGRRGLPGGRGRERRARLLRRQRRQRPPVPRAGAPAVFPRQWARSDEMLEGHMIADIIPTFGMINMIGGECDR